jgi:oxidase EvaA
MNQTNILLPPLRVEDAAETARRFTESASVSGTFLPTSECQAWLAARQEAHGFQVNRIPFGTLEGWSFSGKTGDLVHDSGRFFAVTGLKVRRQQGQVVSWRQPIIVQPEIGILGILVKEFDGILHCLMQAKMEPGNSNIVQLSPTVQATRSNYTRVHKGSATPYLDYFLAPREGKVLVDSLQSEQGGFFLHKRNRNIIVETEDDVELLPDFCWLTVSQVQDLLLADNVVNMDARTVLSGIPFSAPAPSEEPSNLFRDALVRSLDPDAGALHTLAEAVSWFTENKSRYDLMQERIPLSEVDGWHRTSDEIAHESGKFFKVVAVDVRAGAREVTRWTQPLLAPVAPALLAFLVKRFDGVLHVLLQARVAAGTFDIVEAGPSVHCTPEHYAEDRSEGWPAYLDDVLHADPSRVHFDNWLSEEGGRFYHAKNRYLVVEVADDFPAEEPENFLWLTVHQLMALMKCGYCLNVEARTLLACMHALW